MTRNILDGSQLWYAGNCIGRLSGKSNGYGGYEGANLIIDDPSVAELLSRHFLPDAPLEIGQQVQYLAERIAPARITARRFTESASGARYEYLTDDSELWIGAEAVVCVVAPTGWVDPNPPVERAEPEVGMPQREDRK